MNFGQGFFVGVLFLAACTDPGIQATPEGVVQKVFEVASSKNYQELKGLCAPEADQGIQKICDLSDATADQQARFSEEVSQGSYDPAQIMGDKATISLKNKDGKADGKVFLVQKKGRWYMVSGE
ncbi:hypothetical protein [Acaryochloris sp. IP29b_bin.137]|uniref:hypothetical protein n=1 Tax=Acaryochloris sp. IP29b_bin.137 TaxID=2969217 RepID=UPI00262E19A5|nr:hypothetical protein [Acaryochloris sp. IP29b_bin.137]